MFEGQRPEVTTVVRWLLRLTLVLFLAWLLRRRPEQDEEDDEGDVAQSDHSRASSNKSRPVAARTAARVQPRRESYPAAIRQRRPQSTSDGLNFDAVIDKMSKPKEMWEVRKSGEPLQINRQQAHQDTSPSEGLQTHTTPKQNVPSSIAKKADAQDGKEDSLLKKKEQMLHGHERPVTFITWNRECNLLFTCSKDKQVRVWSTPEGECLGSYAGHAGAVWACSVTHDSRWLVTSGADRLVIVWEARTSRELARIELPGVVRYVEWAGGGGGSSSASERFVTCHNRFGAQPPALEVYRFDGTKIEELLRITTLPTAASQVRWGRGDYLLASAHENGELIFWRADTGAEVRKLKAHDAAISKFDFTTDREVVATVSLDKSVKVWDLGKGSEWKLLHHIKTDRPLNAVALGPLMRAAVASSGELRSQCCSVLAAGGQDVRDVALSTGDSEQFGILLYRFGSKDEFPSELEAMGVTKGHFGPVHSVAFASDGTSIASGSEDGCVRVHVFETPVAISEPAEESSSNH